MLLDYGIGTQSASWHVLESKAPMYARVYYILGGKTTYTSGSCTKVLKKGFLYIFPSHTPYEMTTAPTDPISCLYLHLDLHTADLSHLVTVEAEKDLQLTHLIQVIRDAIEGEYPASYLETLVHSLESLCLIKNLFATVDADTSRCIEALRNTYRTDLPLDPIAASLGYSTEYFIRMFKKKLGVSPHQYVISLRMSDAVRMLARGASLEEIAAVTGYTDGHSFANAFRRYYGISPGVYRKHYAGSV